MRHIAANQLIDRRFSAGGRACNDILARLQNLAHLERDDGDEQVALVLVVIVDRADGHFGGGGNRLHLHVLIALRAEQGRGRLQDTVVTMGFLLLPEA